MTDRKLTALVLAVAVAAAAVSGATTYGLFTDTETAQVQVAGNVPAAGNAPTDGNHPAVATVTPLLVGGPAVPGDDGLDRLPEAMVDARVGVSRRPLASGGGR